MNQNPNANVTQLRNKASWKVTRINSGFLSQLDCTAMEGFDADEYLRLVKQRYPKYTGKAIPRQYRSEHLRNIIDDTTEEDDDASGDVSGD